MKENAFQILLMACVFLVINKDYLKENIPEEIKVNITSFFLNMTKIFKPTVDEIKKSGVILANGFGFDALAPTQLKKKYNTESTKPSINVTEIGQNMY